MKEKTNIWKCGVYLILPDPKSSIRNLLEDLNSKITSEENPASRIRNLTSEINLQTTTWRSHGEISPLGLRKKNQKFTWKPQLEDHLGTDSSSHIKNLLEDHNFKITRQRESFLPTLEIYLKGHNFKIKWGENFSSSIQKFRNLPEDDNLKITRGENFSSSTQNQTSEIYLKPQL